MLLWNINVAQTTDTTVTVEFKGEGNDLITVRMSADPGLSEEQTVDEPLIRMVLAEALIDEGYHVSIASNVLEAIRP